MKEVPPHILTITKPSLSSPHHPLLAAREPGSAFDLQVVDTDHRKTPAIEASLTAADAPADASPMKRMRTHRTSVQIDDPTAESPVIWDAADAGDAEMGAKLAEEYLRQATGASTSPDLAALNFTVEES